jgi:hypothetical protein
MVGRGAWVLAAVAVLATVGALGVASAGGDDKRAARAAQGRTPNLVIARFGGQSAEGVVYAARQGRLRRVGVGVSLHSLATGRRYEVLGMTRTCEQSVDAGAREGFTLFRATVPSWEVEDYFAVTRAPMRGSLRNVRSVRLYVETEDGGFEQRGCATAAVFIGGGAATGAIIG